MIFLIPGKGETLRVNGRACVIRDEAILERSAVNGKRPMLGIGVEVEEAFLHCAKSIKRSKLWEQESWPELSALPSIGQMFLDHTQIADKTANQLDDYLEEGYKRLY